MPQRFANGSHEIVDSMDMCNAWHSFMQLFYQTQWKQIGVAWSSGVASRPLTLRLWYRFWLLIQVGSSRWWARCLPCRGYNCGHKQSANWFFYGLCWAASAFVVRILNTHLRNDHPQSSLSESFAVLVPWPRYLGATRCFFIENGQLVCWDNQDVLGPPYCILYMGRDLFMVNVNSGEHVGNMSDREWTCGQWEQKMPNVRVAAMHGFT